MTIRLNMSEVEIQWRRKLDDLKVFDIEGNLLIEIRSDAMHRNFAEGLASDE